MTTVMLLDLNLLLLKSSTVFGIQKIFAKIEIFVQKAVLATVNKIIKTWWLIPFLNCSREVNSKSAFFLFSQFTFVLLIRLDLKIQLINHRTLIKSREKKSQDRWKLGDYA
jgi:hypothetical protein